MVVGAAVRVLIVGAAALAVAVPAGASAQPVPPSVLDDRPAAGGTAPSDPALRARFLAEYLAAPPGDARRVIETHLPTLGVAGILDALEARFASCHGRAHEVGKAGYARSRDLAGVLAACQARCTGGCMHGVVMEAFTEAPGGLRARVPRLCDEEGFRRLYKKGDCAHGVGHGVAYVAGYDMDEALALCERMREKAYQYYCASGAFMQLFMAKERELAARPGHEPCDAASRFAAACYRYKVFYLLQRLGREGKGLDAVIAECLALPARIQPACFHGIGHAHVGPVSQAPARIREVCERGPEGAQWLCIQGVVEKLAEFDGTLAGRVCAELRGRNAKVCREAARNKLYAPRKAGFEHYFVGR